MLVVLASPAGAETRVVFGYAGELGEWELDASVSEKPAFRSLDLAGPFTMKHVGICTVEGPEEKKGEIHVRLSQGSMRGTLSIDGVECQYRGRLSDFYSGVMNCPDRPDVPLKLWVK